ncbi:hypothetical protein HHI36_014510 [Cryptolaemus montrouzieri]|uniref:Uncharacterized protein n=1 Tax=Cryptolaemus montrouzieri TaxID=559131 RepID=A0ABD2N323_9CUCU
MKSEAIMLSGRKNMFEVGNSKIKTNQNPEVLTLDPQLNFGTHIMEAPGKAMKKAEQLKTPQDKRRKRKDKENIGESGAFDHAIWVPRLERRY